MKLQKLVLSHLLMNIYFSLLFLSHNVASVSNITPCNKVDKPLVVYRFGTVTLCNDNHNNVA